jgi:hypothetical protein
MRPESSDPLRTDELRNPGCPRRFTALRKFPQGGGALAIRFFGSTCVFPASNQSTPDAFQFSAGQVLS